MGAGVRLPNLQHRGREPLAATDNDTLCAAIAAAGGVEAARNLLFYLALGLQAQAGSAEDIRAVVEACDKVKALAHLDGPSGWKV